MKIDRLTPFHLEAWLEFFDSRAFADHHDWSQCYCTFYHYPRFKEAGAEKKSKRSYAQWLVTHKKMEGYLVFDAEKAIAWCNAGNKGNYPKLAKEDEDTKGIKSIVCFLVQREYRKKGIARSLLKRIIEDSREDGTKTIEAYPDLNATDEFGNYHGPLKMYLEEGFVVVKTGRVQKVVLDIQR